MIQDKTREVEKRDEKRRNRVPVSEFAGSTGTGTGTGVSPAVAAVTVTDGCGASLLCAMHLCDIVFI
jgi:hypothetical protein